MKDLVLDDVLSVGIEEIDEDHRRLVDLFNLLNHSVVGGDDPAYRAALLEELINCTAWHFSHEERLMLKYRYGDYDEHRAEHKELMDSVRALQQKILQQGDIEAGADLEYLEQWLTGHILSHDMKLGYFLADVM